MVPDGKRKTICLSRVDKKLAESIRVHVEALLASRISGLPVQPATATWPNTIGEALKKKLPKVGLESWPRLRHNLRASCESDLAQAFPLAVVTKWLGNSPSIALRHYVDPADTACRLALRWIPKATQGSKSVHSNTAGVQTNNRTESGTRVAQNAAKRVPTPTGKPEKFESQGVFNHAVVRRGRRRNLRIKSNLLGDGRLEGGSVTCDQERSCGMAPYSGGSVCGAPDYCVLAPRVSPSNALDCDPGPSGDHGRGALDCPDTVLADSAGSGLDDPDTVVADSAGNALDCGGTTSRGSGCRPSDCGEALLDCCPCVGLGRSIAMPEGLPPELVAIWQTLTDVQRQAVLRALESLGWRSG